jgi:non-heme chloroperoxidase
MNLFPAADHARLMIPLIVSFLCTGLTLAQENRREQGDLKRITVNNAEIAYLEHGRGETIILVHGGLGDYRSWDAQVRALAAGFDVITYSRRYHFPNRPITDGSDYSVNLHASDLAAFIRQLGQKRVHLVAHSYGGAIAAIVAAKHPEIVDRLVLIEPRLFSMLPRSSETEEFKTRRINVTTRVAEYLKTGEKDQAIKAFFSFSRGSDELEGLSPIILGIARDNLSTLWPMLTAVEPANVFSCEDAQKITAPTLLVKGERSPAIYTSLTKYLSGCLQRPEQVMISRASHGVMQENPKAFNKAALKFLKADK